MLAFQELNCMFYVLFGALCLAVCHWHTMLKGCFRLGLKQHVEYMLPICSRFLLSRKLSLTGLMPPIHFYIANLNAIVERASKFRNVFS